MATVNSIILEKDQSYFVQVEEVLRRHGATSIVRTQATRERKMELLLLGAYKIQMNVDPEEMGMELWQYEKTLYLLDTWLM